MYKIINAHKYKEGIEAAAKYINSKWGSPANLLFYLDAMKNAYDDEDKIPKFYLLMKDDDIAGCCAIITNDFISRHDLYPWMGCLYVEETHRGKQLGRKMLDFCVAEASKMGYDEIYLTTDHEGYYEKYGWIRIKDGYEPSGEVTRIYMRECK